MQERDIGALRWRIDDRRLFWLWPIFKIKWLCRGKRFRRRRRLRISAMRLNWNRPLILTFRRLDRMQQRTERADRSCKGDRWLLRDRPIFKNKWICRNDKDRSLDPSPRRHWPRQLRRLWIV